MLVAGVALVVTGTLAQRSAPRIPLTATSAADRQGPGGTPSTTSPSVDRHPSSTADTQAYPPSSTTPHRHTLPASRPTELTIPAIGVHSRLITLGLKPDHSVEVPAGAKVDHAGWYTGSPAPGQDGPAVILGHVDSRRSGPSVFFKLGALHAGDRISVKRADGRTVHFTVYGVQRYAKSDFPTVAVYGNTEDPQLRLITCGGSLNAAGSHHVDNTVVYARQS